MPGLREEITKTLHRLMSGEQPPPAAREETLFTLDSRENRQFAAFRILRRLGYGGMGQVYLGVDTRLGRHVALKFLPAHIASDFNMLQRLHLTVGQAAGGHEAGFAALRQSPVDPG